MTMPGLKKWCIWQVECCDFEGFACMASSAEGHVFHCTYKEDGFWIQNAKGERYKPQHPSQKPGRYEGICEDYQPPESE